MPSAPPRRPGGPLAPAAVALAFWVTMAGTTVPTPLYPLYQRAFGFSTFTVTVIFAVYALGVVAGLLTLGRLSDRIGRRPVVLAALLLAAAAATLFELADSLPWLLVARVLSGFGAALVTGAATAALLDLAPPERRLRAQTVALAANMGGLAGGTLFAGALAEWTGSPLRLPWTVTLVLTGAALLGLLAVPETVPAEARRTGRAGSPAGSPSRFRPRPLHVPPGIRPAFLRAALAGGAGFAVTGVLTAVSGLFLATVLNLHNHALTGLVVALAFLSTAVGQLLVRVLPPDRALPLACAGLVLAAALVAGALLGGTLPPLLLGACVNGLATGTAIGTGLGTVNAGVEPHRRGETVSAFFAVLFTMLSVPVIGVGVLVRATGLRTAGVTFSAAVAVLALAVAAGLVRRPRGEASPVPAPAPVTTATATATADPAAAAAPATPAGKA
ncbi:Predicted arabinose efflux permease, MFS family [Streptomyces sp. TLI_053]|uniref:MFS transporter n=1 Tax=Streptomyces sp. TLI_053 TaxID=1855352 RepID=UPI00087C88D9|nr:MFS transporter [Streptomyces sp. TLI_053]SDT38286.1 Predicted arabinose efflux permease, MFS family [Streptomyces sp. TLI_053]